MARSTFEGPVLAGTNRFGPLRNVGYVDMVQNCDLVLTNANSNTSGYAGGSGVYVASNGIPNNQAVVYTPSATTYPPVAATITADAGTSGSGTLYRGCVFYIPYGSQINDILIDTGVAITMTGGTVGTVAAYISNGFNTGTTPAYAAITSINTVGRQSLNTFTTAQLANQQATSGDITNPPGAATGGGQSTDPNSSLVSQVVVNINIPYSGGSGTTLPVLTAGTFYATIRYAQLDQNIGSTTAYPYGNFD
jgi:hypothetical protein